MLSPKFPQKLADLKSIVNESRLKTTWKNRVRDAMRRQPVPDVLEYLDFHTRVDATCAALTAEVYSGSYAPRSPIRLLAEKSKGLCRQLVVPSAKDALVLQTLSDALWFDIRPKAPSPNAFYEPGDQKFSNKKESDDPYETNAWLSFQSTILGFRSKKPWLVITDIANYYDSISYEHLRNVLADLSLQREHALDLLIFTLSSMLWQPDYMPRIPIGLPQMTLDAPRLLAHTFLFEIDKILVARQDIEYARYMDDIDIGVDSPLAGKIVLRDLDLSLQARQIRLNSGKTRIISQAEALVHFKIRENQLTDKIEERVNNKLTATPPLAPTREAKVLSRVIGIGLRGTVFRTGNGDKVLKRLLRLAGATGAQLDASIVSELLINWPSVRENLLRWWQHQNDPMSSLPSLVKSVVDSQFVDDLSIVQIATAVVSAKLPLSAAATSEIQALVKALGTSSTWRFWATIWVLSKYGSPYALMRVIESSSSTWVAEEQLSRLVAGQYPRFLGTTLLAKFEAIIARSGNAWSQSVLQFHRELNTSVTGYTGVRKFLEVPNPSLPNAISHSKFLMVISAIKNPQLTQQVVAKLKQVHSIALSDQYYAAMI